MLIKSRVFIAACFLSVAACAHDSHEEEKQITLCKDPRPQMCTMNYTPVCGLIEKKEVKTYGNACGACGDVNVSAYLAEECQADSLKLFNVEKQLSENSAKKSKQ